MRHAGGDTRARELVDLRHARVYDRKHGMGQLNFLCVCHDQNTVPVQLYFEGIGSLVELEVHSQVEYLHSAVEFPHECIKP